MKKRIVALLFAMLVSVSSVFMLVSCGGNKNTDGTGSDVNKPQTGTGTFGEEIK